MTVRLDLAVGGPTRFLIELITLSTSGVVISPSRTSYRDFDGVSREVEAEGRTRSAAETNLLKKLRQRASSRHGGSLRSIDRFSVAAELWFRTANRDGGGRSTITRHA
jgi:hypothetical protein